MEEEDYRCGSTLDPISGCWRCPVHGWQDGPLCDKGIHDKDIEETIDRIFFLSLYAVIFVAFLLFLYRAHLMAECGYYEEPVGKCKLLTPK